MFQRSVVQLLIAPVAPFQVRLQRHFTHRWHIHAQLRTFIVVVKPIMAYCVFVVLVSTVLWVQQICDLIFKQLPKLLIVVFCVTPMRGFLMNLAGMTRPQSQWHRNSKTLPRMDWWILWEDAVGLHLLTLRQSPMHAVLWSLMSFQWSSVTWWYDNFMMKRSIFLFV